MAEIVNLNRVRKQRARDEGRKQAEENRVRFGRTLQQRDSAAREQELARKTLEDKKLEDEKRD